ncbi:MAG: hypothetical protein RLZZ280_1875, partial [Pseudomonadota bacterium]
MHPLLLRRQHRLWISRLASAAV